MTVDGRAVPAYAEDGVTYVQLSSLLDALGGWETQWDHHARVATAETDLFTLDVPAQRSYVLADGFPYGISQGSVMRAERTYVPLRSMANLLGAQVNFSGWDSPVTVREIGAPSSFFPITLSAPFHKNGRSAPPSDSIPDTRCRGKDSPVSLS